MTFFIRAMQHEMGDGERTETWQLQAGAHGIRCAANVASRQYWHLSARSERKLFTCSLLLRHLQHMPAPDLLCGCLGLRAWPLGCKL